MLERYGFSGGTFPSPNGAPGQGWRVDPHIAAQFERWFAEHGEGGPWCTTVSLVNPHDISWWYDWTDRLPAETNAPSVVTSTAAQATRPAAAPRAAPSRPCSARCSRPRPIVRCGVPFSGTRFTADLAQLPPTST